MIIIPARLQSNRFPKKVLADINGYPMVIATANRIKDIDKVVIATDSSEVVDIAKAYGFDAVITSKSHKSGTDRVNEAAVKLKLDDNEVIVNVQADEPFIEPSIIKNIIDKITLSTEKNEDIMMVSCYKLIDKNQANDPNLVKVITNFKNHAIYFSRSKIPYDREEHFKYYGHLGVYGFTKKSLQEFCSLPLAPIEDIEKLEQLRAIYFDKKIAMIEVQSESFGIDTKEDLAKALKKFS
jgi:3-deoxy-manno-octulosonate cytidylyltransferase (CMP-KDO synthetase)